MNISFKNIQSDNKTGERYFASVEPGVVFHGKTINYPFLCPITFEITKRRPINSRDVEFIGNTKYNTVCEVKNVKAFGYSSESSEKFLSTSYFKNTIGSSAGDTSIKKIIATLGENIFSESYLNEETLIESIKGQNIGKEAVLNISKKLRSIKNIEEVFDYITSYGGSYESATCLYANYDENTINAVKTNPYNLLKYGGTIEMCDKIAHDNDMSYSDFKRLESIVNHITWHNEVSHGNTMLSFTELYRMLRSLEKRSGCFNTDPFYVANVLLKGDYVLKPISDNEVNVWRKKTYFQEKALEHNIRRINSTSVPLVSDMIEIDEIEDMLKIKYSDDQKKAFECLNKSGVKVVTGGPGTGKTTFLNGILLSYQLQNPTKGNILLCAPTGCAAMRMKNSTGKEAITIHSALGLKPYTDNEVIDAELDADLIVVDESSMMDTFIAACLFKSVKNGATVILMGDADQLPSVSAGNVFKDIIDSGEFEVYRLNKIFRQKGKSSIVENSKKIINGNPELTKDSSFDITYFSNDEEIAKNAYEYAINNFNPKKFKIFSPVKKAIYKTGTMAINNYLHEEFKKGNEVIYNGYHFSEGDTVMFTKNNRELKVVNGQEGVIKSIQQIEGKDYLSIETEGEYVTITGKDLSELELSYAVTAHKSQGSEIDNALILIPERPISMLKRQLLYVEVTRAKKHIQIYCTEKSLKAVLSENNETPRSTGLFKET